MSSFANPHFLYVFDMTNGKKKLAYGASPDDAYESLKLRLTEKEVLGGARGATWPTRGRHRSPSC